MKKIIRVLLVIGVVLIGFGFYRGWFALSSEQQAGSNKIDVNLTVDPDQVKSDTGQATPKMTTSRLRQ
jgi:hypothetical protein